MWFPQYWALNIKVEAEYCQGKGRCIAGFKCCARGSYVSDDLITV